MRSTSIVVSALLFTAAGLVTALDPNSVALSTRQIWCQSQLSSCPLLCLQLPGNSATTVSNTCDATSLTYSCICGNGQSPNASEYTQTLPYFICTETNNQCVNACAAGDNTCQSACRQNHLCGAQDPTRYNLTTTSSAGATATTTSIVGGTSGSAGVVYTGLGGTGAAASSTGAAASSTGAAASGTGAAASSMATSSTKSGAALALTLGQSYGLGVVVAGIFAGFALLL